MKRHLLYTLVLASFVICSCSKRANGPASPMPPDPYAHIGDDNAVVFAASEGGKLYALDANSGVEKWNFTLNSSTVRNAQLSSPAYADNILYVGSTDQNIYAVNATTGKEVWRYPTNSTLGFFYSSPVVANGVVYLPGYEQRFYALDAKSGTLKWAKDFPREFESSPAYYNNRLFITSNDGVLYALNAADGSTQWTQGGSGYDWGIDYAHSSPCVKDGVLYALADDVGRSTSNLNELSTEDGTAHHGVYASYYIPSIDTYISSPVIDDSVVYFGGLDDSLYAAKIGDMLFFNRRWAFKAGQAIYSSPAFDDSTVYVGANDGYLYALNKDSGTLKWKFNAQSLQVVSSPVVVNGVVFFGAENYFYALYAKDGNIKWRAGPNMFFSSSPVVLTKQGKAYHGGVSGMKN